MNNFSIKNYTVCLQLHADTNPVAPRATEDQIKSASSLLKRVDLKNFSVCQFANPGKFSILKDNLIYVLLMYAISVVNGELVSCTLI